MIIKNGRKGTRHFLGDIAKKHREDLHLPHKVIEILRRFGLVEIISREEKSSTGGTSEVEEETIRTSRAFDTM